MVRRGRSGGSRGRSARGGRGGIDRHSWKGFSVAPELHELICPVCQSLLVRPAALPCGHRFCLECIESSGLTCPLCRKRIGAWLRRAKAEDGLVDETLWAYIRERFADRLPENCPVSPISSQQSPVLPRLCAPGEIRNEYETELKKIQEERELFEKKYSDENEKLIRKLQEADEAEKEAHEKLLKLDESYAKELEESLVNTSISGPSTSTAVQHNKAHNKSETLDKYFERPHKNADSLYSKSSSSAASPELITTVGRCSRFIKNFFNRRLWGLKTENENSNGDGLQKCFEAGDQHTSKDVMREKVFNHLENESEHDDLLAPDLCYFKPIHPIPVNRFNGNLIKSRALKKVKKTQTHINGKRSLDVTQLADALHKLRNINVTTSCAKSAFVCLLRLPISQSLNRESTPNVSKTSQDKKSDVNGQKHSPDILCNLSHYKLRNSSRHESTGQDDKSPKTPKTSSLVKPKIKSTSQSCSKINYSKNSNANTVKLKRRLSFDGKNGLNPETNGRNGRILRNHSYLNNNYMKPEENGSKTFVPEKVSPLKKKNGHVLNGTMFSNYGAEDASILNLDPSLIEEQKYIEKLIQQEKKDYDLAKQLQEQETGSKRSSRLHPVRSASKRQATITEVLTNKRRRK